MLFFIPDSGLHLLFREWFGDMEDTTTRCSNENGSAIFIFYTRPQGGNGLFQWCFHPAGTYQSQSPGESAGEIVTLVTEVMLKKRIFGVSACAR